MKKPDFNLIFDSEDFEDFGCDIIQVRDNIVLERYKKTHDAGIDGFYSTNNNKNIVVQCKNTKDVNKLINELIKVELPKMQKIKPDRYILVISKDITRAQKLKLLDYFKDYIKDSHDLIMAEDLHGFSRNAKYNQVFDYYYQKYLNNFNLYTKPNSNINSWLKDDWNKIKSYFVETECYKEAKNFLLNNHVLILTGDPGSGKTTNAKMLLNYLYEKRLVSKPLVINTCNQVKEQFDSNISQAFLIDDFWGATFIYDNYKQNTDRDLDEIITKLQNSNSYLILTTREYVLNQGVKYYKEYNLKALDKRIFCCNSYLMEEEKIKILYNHFYKADFDYNILSNLKYYVKKIIEHPNYSPRTISYFVQNSDNLVGADGFEIDKVTNFYNDFMFYLDNPRDYLENIFIKLSLGARIVAFILALSNPPINLDYLYDSFKVVAKNIRKIKISEFNEYLKELLDLFLQFNYLGNIKIIDFTNNSIFDFINDFFLDVYIDYEDYFSKGLKYFNQILNLFNFNISKDNQEYLINYIVDNFDEMLNTNGEGLYLEELDKEENENYWYLLKNIEDLIDLEKDINSETIREFLTRRIKTYFKKDIQYYDSDNENFFNAPDLLQKVLDININYSNEEIRQMIEDFIDNCESLSYLVAIASFPEIYKDMVIDILKIKHSYIFNDLAYYLEQEYLNEDNLQLDDFFKDNLKDMCKYLKILLTKQIRDILNKYNPPREIKVKKSFNKIKPPLKNDIERVIEEFDKKIYKPFNLNKVKLRKLINNSKLESKIKENLLNDKQDYYCFSLLDGITEEFVNLVIKVILEEKVYTDGSFELFDYLCSYISKQDINLGFLLNYALYSTYNSYNYLSLTNIIANFEVTEEEINNLINLGVLVKNLNIIMFSSTLWQIYLCITFLRLGGDDELVLDFITRPGIICMSEFKMIQVFMQYKFCNIIKPIFEKIINLGYENFKNYMLDMGIDNQGAIIFSQNDDLKVIDSCMQAFLDMNIYNEISNIFKAKKYLKMKKYLDKHQAFSILNYYNDITNKENEDIYLLEQTCKNIFDLINKFYQEKLVDLGLLI